ncbi:MAG TPA: hypothetical protein VM901_04275 [Bdellovibrionota bacterium]|nr:hypothetical protein [Bdellovibrionota bacterium]
MKQNYGFVALSLSLSLASTFAGAQELELSDNFVFGKSEAEISAFYKEHLGAFEVSSTEYGSAMVEAQFDAEVRADVLSYDPVLTTLAAGLESRNYDRGVWQETWVDAAEAGLSDPYYQKNVRFYQKLTNDGTKRPLVIFLGSSFSTWKRGTWLNKTVALVEKTAFEPVNFIAMPGFLTPEVLSFAPRRVDITGELMARDLLPRLRRLVARINQESARIDTTKIYLVGASGGASLALEIAAVDGTLDEPLISKVIAFNPVLDLKTTNSVLDAAKREAFSAGVQDGLTTPKSLVVGLFDPPSDASLVRMLGARDSSFAGKRQKITRMFYNEFTVVDLKTAADSTQSADFRWGQRSDGASGDNYADFYEIYAMDQTKRLGANRAGYDFEHISQVIPRWRNILAQTTIVFPEDDPVLSRLPSERDAPERILTRFEQIRYGIPRVKLFTPKRGAHMGYFLDTAWLEGVFTDLTQ